MLLAWDKPAARAWEAHADRFADAARTERSASFLAHPASSVRWAQTDDEEDRTSWRYFNSAKRACQLPVCWAAVYRLAASWEAEGRLKTTRSTQLNPLTEAPVTSIDVVQLDSHLPIVANVPSLERALAAALLCRLVEATVVPGPTTVKHVPPPANSSPSHGLRLRSEMRRSRVGAELFMSPSSISLRRGTMPLCWPKVWHFAKMLKANDASERDGNTPVKSLGAVPVQWHAKASRWEATHRHRVLAGVLAGEDIRVVVDGAQTLHDGSKWQLPSKTRLRLASHVADLLALGAADPTSDRHVVLVKRAREAMRKAPQECTMLGISAELRQLLRLPSVEDSIAVQGVAAPATSSMPNGSPELEANEAKEAASTGYRDEMASTECLHATARHLAFVAGSPFLGAAASLATARPFERLVVAALAANRVLELSGRTMCLRSCEVRIPNGGRLVVRGPGTIVGDGHTLLRIGGSRQSLELEDVVLIHLASSERVERREQGGVLYALGKARVTLRRCTLASETGFGVWMVQNSAVILEGCGMRIAGGHEVGSLSSPTILFATPSLTYALRLHQHQTQQRLTPP
mmetsp:Transcript_914/g.2487  ORF Transcript_914/g.2487 Transcript_914/m.2487 type:complete len:577 (+) Transcript_914:3-1733(+)